MSNIKIRISKQDGVVKYLVPAISLQKKDESILIPSPFGTQVLVFTSLEDAVNSIQYAGYQYTLDDLSPSIALNSDNSESKTINYDKLINVFVNNLGHEKLEIRNTAIKSLIKFGPSISEQLLNILKTETNWLVLQSVIKCIEGIINNDKASAPIFTDELINASNSDNSFVRAAALNALEKILN